MLTIKISFALAYIIDAILSLVGSAQISKQNDEKISVKEYFVVIVCLLAGLWMLWYNSKLYFLIGLLVASLSLLLFSFADADEEFSGKISFSRKFFVTFLSFFFWLQLICSNYLVVTKLNKKS